MLLCKSSYIYIIVFSAHVGHEKRETEADAAEPGYYGTLMSTDSYLFNVPGVKYWYSRPFLESILDGT